MNTNWFGHREGGINMWGEWEAYPSWSLERRIFPGVDNIRLLLSVDGVMKKGKAKPRRWSARLSIFGWEFPLPSTHPSCNSVRDATRQADRFFNFDFFIESMSKVSQRKRYMSVSKVNPYTGEIEPFCTDFSRYFKWRTYPYGEYFTVGERINASDGEPSIASYKIDGFGMIGGGRSEMKGQVQRWI